MRKISRRKSFLLIIILFVVAFLTIAINNSIRNFNYLKTNKSPLEDYISKVNINELDIALSELNEIILYIGYNHSKDIRKLDREILKKIKANNLENYIYYCDVTDELNNNIYLGNLISLIPELNGKLKKVPALVYFKNSEVIEVINSTNKLIISEDLIYLVNKYKIGK